jgi:hypothetical protein
MQHLKTVAKLFIMSNYFFTFNDMPLRKPNNNLVVAAAFLK